MQEEILTHLEHEIIKVLTSKVKNIIEKTRKNMVVIEEKTDGDSATIADIDGENFRLLRKRKNLEEATSISVFYKNFY